MDILLTNSFFLQDDPGEQEIMKPFPPLGLLALSAYLKSHHFSVELIDNTFSTKPELFAKLRQLKPGIIGISINMMTKIHALAIIKEAKALGIDVIVGGPDPANYADEYLDFGADIVVIGEGEETLAQLIPVLGGDRKENLDSVNGIVYKDGDGNHRRTAPRTLLADIDTLPFPDREGINITRYLETWRAHHDFGPMSIITARGCPYTCTWCSHSVFGKSLRKRSPRLVVDEIETIIEQYHPDALWFADDVFNINHKWLFALADELVSRRIHIAFDCTCRADRMNEKIMQTLKEMGCQRIWFGSESGSQRLLDAMERGVKAKQVQQMTRLANELGIKTGMFLMWGYEDETREDIRQTIEHVKKANPDQVLTTLSYPIKGTEYYRRMVEDKSIVYPENWASSTDRSHQIRGRFSRRFYHFVNRWLYSEIGLQQLEHSSFSIIPRAKLHLNLLIGKLGMALTSSQTDV